MVRNRLGTNSQPVKGSRRLDRNSCGYIWKERMIDPQEAILRKLRAKILTINSRFLLIRHVRNLSDAGLPEIPDYRIIFSEI